MMHIIIVDDDKAILAGLNKLIDWERYGCQVDRSFWDPCSALEYCAANAPDLVITDIRMPGMLGLTLVAKLKDILPDTVFIMLTAYDDFNYAKQAVNNGVFRYLLKPIDEGELIEALAAAEQTLRMRRQISSERREFHDYVRTHTCIEFLYGLLSLGAPLEDSPSVAPGTEALYKNGALAGYRVAVMHRIHGAARRALPASAYPAFVISTTMHDIFILVGEDAPYARWAAQVTAVAEAAGEKCAISDLCSSLKELYADCAMLTGFLDARAFLSDEPVFTFSAPPYPARQQREQAQLGALLAGLPDLYAQGDLPGLEDTLKSIRTLLHASQYPPSPTEVKNAFQRVFMELAAYYREYYGERVSSMETLEQYGARLRLSTSYNEVETLCVEMFGELFSQGAPAGGSSSLRIVNMAKVYIAQNMDKQMSISDIASAVYVSPSYLSALFKKRTGEKLWSYVIRVRLEKAYDYLVKTDMHIHQIAKACGFQSTNTFYYSFKKQYGFAPGRFRQQNEEE